MLTLRSVSVNRPHHYPRSHCQKHMQKSVPNITVQSTVHSPGLKNSECQCCPTRLVNQNKSNTMVTWTVALLAPLSGLHFVLPQCHYKHGGVPWGCPSYNPSEYALKGCYPINRAIGRKAEFQLSRCTTACPLRWLTAWQIYWHIYWPVDHSASTDTSIKR